MVGAMAFDPSAIPDDACVAGHLDETPIYALLLDLAEKKVTGRLSIDDAVGPNHMYFMSGQPVGVLLSETFHPLGQLLLELGRIDSATFVRAQPLILDGNRLPGQVFIELGVLDEVGLREVLSIQARRKAEHFCRLGSRPFTFCRGLTYLSGFTATPLEAQAVVFVAVRQQLGEQAREAWLQDAADDEVRLAGGGSLPAAVPGMGFAEEKLLSRLRTDFVTVPMLIETGPLPREDLAVLLRYLEVIGRLERRKATNARADKADKAGADLLATPRMFNVPHTDPRPTGMGVPDDPRRRPAADALGDPGRRGAVPPRHPLPVGIDPATLVDATADAIAAPIGQTAPARPQAQTAPRGLTPASDPTTPLLARPDPPPAAPSPAPVSPPPLPPPLPRTPTPALKSVLVPDEAPLDDEDFPAPIVRKKKKVKRTEPLPSESTGVVVSETRTEKASVSSLPTIVIASEDD